MNISGAVKMEMKVENSVSHLYIYSECRVFSTFTTGYACGMGWATVLYSSEIGRCSASLECIEFRIWLHAVLTGQWVDNKCDLRLISQTSKMKFHEVLACSFPEWYPLLKKVTFPSQIISLSRAFVECLLADNVVLGSNQPLVSCDQINNSDDSDNDSDEWGKAEIASTALEVKTNVTTIYLL